MKNWQEYFINLANCHQSQPTYFPQPTFPRQRGLRVYQQWASLSTSVHSSVLSTIFAFTPALSVGHDFGVTLGEFRTSCPLGKVGREWNSKCYHSLQEACWRKFTPVTHPKINHESATKGLSVEEQLQKWLDTDAGLNRKLQDSLLNKKSILAKPQDHSPKNVKTIVLPHGNPSTAGICQL